MPYGGGRRRNRRRHQHRHRRRPLRPPRILFHNVYRRRRSRGTLSNIITAVRSPGQSPDREYNRLTVGILTRLLANIMRRRLLCPRLSVSLRSHAFKSNSFVDAALNEQPRRRTARGHSGSGSLSVTQAITQRLYPGSPNFVHFQWKKSAQRRRKHCALVVVRRSQKNRPAADPFPGAWDGQNLISWR